MLRADPAAYARNMGSPILPGKLGVYASHLAVWELLLASPHKAALVFEDDTVLHADFPEALDSALAAAAQWDLLRFNCVRAKWPVTQGKAGRYRLNAYIGPFTGNAAYLVRRDLAARLLPALWPQTRALDHELNRFFCARLPADRSGTLGQPHRRRRQQFDHRHRIRASAKVQVVPAPALLPAEGGQLCPPGVVAGAAGAMACARPRALGGGMQVQRMVLQGLALDPARPAVDAVEDCVGRPSLASRPTILRRRSVARFRLISNTGRSAKALVIPRRRSKPCAAMCRAACFERDPPDSPKWLRASSDGHESRRPLLPGANAAPGRGSAGGLVGNHT